MSLTQQELNLKLPLKFSDVSLAEYLVGQKTDNPVEILSVWSGKSEEEIRKMPSLATRAMEHIAGVLEEEKSVFETMVNVSGKQYGFIPNWEDFTTGEYIDMDYATQDIWANAYQICSILYREVDGQFKDTKYNIVAYTGKEDQSSFEELPAMNYLGLLLFFLVQERDC